jgi:uncharacterized protein (UPF0332 family)
MVINNDFFKSQSFDRATIKKYFTKAKSNLHIANISTLSEVKFHFSYLALIQIGITLMATINYRVKSKDGHHIMIIENLSELLGDKDINIIGNRMRQKRNADMYGELTTITAKEAKQYQNFVEQVLKSTEEYIFKQKHLL